MGLGIAIRHNIAADEQNHAGAVIDQREQEGMIGTEDERRRGRGLILARAAYDDIHHNRRCGGGLGIFFFDIDRCLVNDMLDFEADRFPNPAGIRKGRHAREIGIIAALSVRFHALG